MAFIWREQDTERPHICTYDSLTLPVALTAYRRRTMAGPRCWTFTLKTMTRWPSAGRRQSLSRTLACTTCGLSSAMMSCLPPLYAARPHGKTLQVRILSCSVQATLQIAASHELLCNKGSAIRRICSCACSMMYRGWKDCLPIERW